MKSLFLILSVFSIVYAARGTFAPPKVSVDWRYDDSSPVKITLVDTSDCETGYRLYRFSGLSAPYMQIAGKVSPDPRTHDTIIFYDSAISYNTWYRYAASAYLPGDSAFAPPCTVFTLRKETRRCIRFTKLSNLSVSLSGWSAKAGDSIILKESTAPEGKYSVIKVNNPAGPFRAGYIDSSALIHFPAETFIPFYLGSGISNGYGIQKTRFINFPHAVLAVKNKFLVYYSAADTIPVAVDSVMESGFNGMLIINDSTLAVCCSTGTLYSHDRAIKLFRIDASGIRQDTEFLTGLSYSGYYGTRASWPRLRGQSGSTLINSVNWTIVSPVGPGGHCLQFYDFDRRFLVLDTLPSIRSLTENAGIMFSPTQFLSRDTAHPYEIFAEDITDLDGYATALLNNSILLDSFSDRRNVFIDTSAKKLFIIYADNISSFSYRSDQLSDAEMVSRCSRVVSGLRIISGPDRSVTIVLPRTSRSADLSFFDLSGRMVDHITVAASNAALWRPKNRAIGCYIVAARVGAERYSARFFIR